ncbi:MAG TPA: hypothetical protein VJG29_00350 [Candidatus Paceibacterota bacterium]
MSADASVFLKDGFFSMLALDHRGSFKKSMGDATDEEMTSRKRDIIQALGNRPSGILIDSDYGLEALKTSGISAPYLMAMEKSGYEERGDERHTELIHTGEEIQKDGAAGAKLLLYMRGDEGDASQIDVAGRALAEAEKASLPLFLEVVIYGEGRGHVGERTLTAMTALQARGVVPSVWKVEAPGTPELATETTRVAGGTPWILLSRGAEFERFTWELKESLAGGARGFLAGRSLWQEALSLSHDERVHFLSTALPERFDILLSVMKEVH